MLSHFSYVCMKGGGGRENEGGRGLEGGREGGREGRVGEREGGREKAREEGVKGMVNQYSFCGLQVLS